MCQVSIKDWTHYFSLWILCRVSLLSHIIVAQCSKECDIWKLDLQICPIVHYTEISNLKKIRILYEPVINHPCLLSLFLLYSMCSGLETVFRNLSLAASIDALRHLVHYSTSIWVLYTL